MEKHPTRSNSKGYPGNFIQIWVKLRTTEANYQNQLISEAGKSYKRGSNIQESHSIAEILKPENTKPVEEDQKKPTSGLRSEVAKRDTPEVESTPE